MTMTISPPSASQSSAPASRPELLAPAGDWEALRAAAANGADAVYFGLDRFNARHRAANFLPDELPELMAYLHGHNVRGYVTFNTLVFSRELEDALKLIGLIAAAGVDAVIVQDLGLAWLIHRAYPGLAVHGSTQMTLTEPLGLEFVRKLGVQRVILARELSAADVRKIRSATDMPIEVFVHGALCVSYSGQCLTSESLGGRSANRGQCAQACRLPYELIVDGQRRDLGEKAYLLSPQDLAAYDIIDELADAGASCFKIEGRLKSAQYVAATTQAYRAAIDAHVARAPFVLSKQSELEMAQSFSRGFTHGFLDGVNHQRLVHARFPKSRGVRAGKVIGITPTGVTIALERSTESTGPTGFSIGSGLSVGDGIVFDEGHPEQDEQGGRIASVTPAPQSGRGEPLRGREQTPSQKGAPRAQHRGPQRATDRQPPAAVHVHVTFERGSVNLGAVAIGATVWKTDDPAIRRRLSASYARDRVVRRVPIKATVRATIGEALEIAVSDDAGHLARVAWAGPLQAALKHPLNETLFREQFGRLGDTPFELTEVLGLESPSAAMVPKSVLNDLRRQATAQLLADQGSLADRPVDDPLALEKARAEIVGRFSGNAGDAQQTAVALYAMARTLEQVEAVLGWRSPVDGVGVTGLYCDFEDVRKYKAAVALARSAGAKVGLATVRIIKPGEEGLLHQLCDQEPDYILIRNLAALSYCALHRPKTPLVADYSLNVSNELTACLLAWHGVARMTPSYDLNWPQMSDLIGKFPAAMFEAVIHQHMPMFHMEHCVFAHTLSSGTDYRTCGRPCDAHKVDLKDRAGAAHPLIPDVGCRNTVYNGQAQTAAELSPKMLALGLRHFRVELLREDSADVAPLLDRYAEVLAGKAQPRVAFRSLRVLNQLGVTAGTLAHE